ncbi:serine hydrolase domain-containing protein [Rheinheimera sp. 4Y26]|uniref:serine hydrolase domain-containing protein n=1 Tax=Rheinheimera sp. 4Y26 TaxID=2977811 RepID=UPI0021B0F093|nr:serine hydrolase [Rheinheimera sp. 4Y26]MCT6701208.1 beta-lactamase family protein [Rheinheimera sp. 4Y26]
MKIQLFCTACCMLAVSSFAKATQPAESRNAPHIASRIAGLKPQQLSSVLVMQHNRLLHESYYNGAGADDLHDIRSASKSLTGLMFGRAIADGYFQSEQDKVLPLFSNTRLLSPAPEKTGMTFFDLLSMTNPLECDDMNELSEGQEEKMYLTKDWVSFFLNLPVRANPPWETPIAQQPYGRDFAYCTAGISVTAAAIEIASGKKLADYTKEALFQPLGITQSQWLFNAMGITQGGGGVRIKPKDLLKIGQLVLNQGNWQGKQLIPKDWIDKSLQSYSEAMPEMNASYGLTWWRFPFQINGKTVDSFAAAGNGGNYLFIVPKLNATAVVTATAYNTPYMHQQTQAIFAKAILPALMQQDQAN